MNARITAGNTGPGRPGALLVREERNKCIMHWSAGKGTGLTWIFIVLAFLLIIGIPPAVASEIYVAKGRASWYGTTAHGKQTANGEIYNKFALTAAHKGLPFGTVVRVKNMKNGKQVLVRVNDRGPYAKGRILDVSRRAAEVLKMVHSGVVPVTMEIIGNQNGEPLNGNNSFYVHLADSASALKTREIVTALGKRLKAPVKALSKSSGKGVSYAVCLGPFDTFEKAQRKFLKLENKQVTALGIIEGPARGRTLTANAARPPGDVMPEDISLSNNELNSNGSVTALLYPYCRALCITPALPIKKSLMLFSIFANLLPGFTGGPDLFCLPYPAFSGYTYSPS